MDRRFAKMFNLTEDQAIALLKKPLDQLQEKSERYVAASHLINFPTQRSIQALIETVEDDNLDLYHRIARRKAIESLGKLKVKQAIAVIQPCLSDPDPYTVENAVWAIGEIGTDDLAILEAIACLLEKPQQSYRLISQVLAKFDYKPALARIQPLIESDDETIASAAIAAVARLTQDYSQMSRVVAFLQHTSVNARRLCIQDLIDTKYYAAIPQIAQSPISLVFRLRGIRQLAATGIPSGKITFADIEPYLDRIITDRPTDLEMVHEYDQKPSLEFLIRELYQTDFGRCYLASQTLLELYPDQAPEALMTTYATEASSDYGAHYHVIKLFGWLQYQPGKPIILQALNNKQPQFQKSRGAAAIALANLGATEAIPLLQETLKSPIFDLKYASLLALEKLGARDSWSVLAEDADLLIRHKATKISKQ
ncbi:MAG TPA: HEAT repeat domain-containing protein [Xenococcaceae cyanobacterium]